MISNVYSIVETHVATSSTLIEHMNIRIEHEL
jgi:hypothetical protein